MNKKIRSPPCHAIVNPIMLNTSAKFSRSGWILERWKRWPRSADVKKVICTRLDSLRAASITAGWLVKLI